MDWTIYNNDKEFQDLTPDQQVEMFSHFAHGGESVYAGQMSGKWYPKKMGTGIDPQGVYRAVPENVRQRPPHSGGCPSHAQDEVP